MSRTEYKYGMRLRGFSIGAQPLSGLKRHEDCPKSGQYSRAYHDILVYNRPLEEWEIRNFELDYLGSVKVE